MNLMSMKANGTDILFLISWIVVFALGKAKYSADLPQLIWTIAVVAVGVLYLGLRKGMTTEK